MLLAWKNYSARVATLMPRKNVVDMHKEERPPKPHSVESLAVGFKEKVGN
jgi:hypothetical protein